MLAPSVLVSARSVLLGFGCLAVLSCAKTSVTGQRAPAPPHSTAMPPPDESGADVNFEPLRGAVAKTLPGMKIVEPAEGETLSEEQAASREVRFTTWGPAPEVVYSVVLDGGRVRTVADAHAAIPFSDLLADDGGVTRGAHVIVVVACSRDGTALRDARGGTAVAVRTFWVGEAIHAGSPAAERPSVVHLLPRGTLNGPAARDSAVLDFVVIGAPAGLARVTVSGVHRMSRHLLDGHPPYSIKGLSQGDYRFDIELLDRVSAVLGTSAGHWITVNPEPLPE